MYSYCKHDHFLKAALALLLFVYSFAVANVWADSPAFTVNDVVKSYPLAQCFDVLEDQAGQYPFAAIQSPALAARFHPAHMSGQINFGYSNTVYWLRCHLHANMAGRKLLEIAYPSLDNVQLYTPEVSQNQKQVSGDLMPFAERPYPHRNIVFPIDLKAGDNPIYLRVQSAGTLTIPVYLWSPDALYQNDTRKYSILAAYYGVFAALGLYNLLLFFSIRDRSYLEYVLFVTGMAIGQASLNGFGNQFFWPNWPVWGNVALTIGFAMAGLFGALFTRSFLSIRENSPRLNHLNWGFVAWFFFAIVLNVVSYQWAAMATSFGGLCYSIFACMAGVSAKRRQHAGARYFLLAWALLLTGVGAMGARNFGWLPTNFFTMYSMQIGSSLEMILLSFALADRINKMRRDKQQAQSEALDAKEKMVEALQSTEADLALRVKQRTYELEQANLKLQESEMALAKAARQDPLTGLGNRMALDNDLEAAIARARRAKTGIAVLLIDLDGFKPVNDTYGHAAGDAALQEIAARLVASVRRSDSVIRIGGDEFVIIVEGLQVLAHAKTVAQKILQFFKTPLQLNDDIAVKLGASIGLSRFPEDGESIRDLLHQADVLMYAAKTDGGNHYFVTESFEADEAAQKRSFSRK